MAMNFNSAESASVVISTFSAALLTVAVMSTTPVSIALDKLTNFNTAKANDALDLAHGIPVTEIANASLLDRIRVESSTGETIGISTAPAFDTDGKIVAIGITMDGGLFRRDTVKRMKAADLIYLRDRKTLVSRLTKSEIAALPLAEQVTRSSL